MLRTFDGDSRGDFLGQSVSGAGDVNGDGLPDLIVGAVGDDNNGIDSGSARIISGAGGGVLYNFNGDVAGDLFGESVSGAGDVNGDGFADLIVGTPLSDSNGPNSGNVRVFSGANGSILYNFDGDSHGHRLGQSVSGAGDVNNDGLDDLIVGSSVGNNDAGRGSARVFSGVDGSILYIFTGDATTDSFGFSVSGAGDVNGDGVADFIVGARDGNGGGGAFSRGYVRLFVSQISAPIILGDCNLDGVVDFLDISQFIAVLASNSFLAQADCNLDGVVDFLDISAFIAILAGN